MPEFTSNSLLFVNVKDGETTQYYLHIKYSAYPDGTDFSDEPNIYLGIYSGPSQTPPTDKTEYTWIKVEGEPGSSSYIDIRYSNDGINFTDNNGLEPGSWLGIYVTDTDVSSDPEYVPVFENYTWSQIQGVGSITPFYYFQSEYNEIYKFYSTQNNFTYTPSSFEITLYERRGSIYNVIKNSIITATCKCTNAEGEFEEIVLPEGTDGVLNINLNDEQFNTKELFAIYIVGKSTSGSVYAEQVYQVSFGTSKEMAKFSLNAASINASILNTKLIFNTDGLTIKNGGFKIIGNNDEEVFYVNETGDLFFSGILETSAGSLGGWLINEHGLYTANETVGLYATDTKFLSAEISNSPIRIWAGKNDETYNFAVTHDGHLYAQQANVKGKIAATSGYITNTFLVGSENSGIIIQGNENGSSYIGSSQFSSGSLGYGWKLNEDGTAIFNNINARGKITSSVFEYNKISSVGGSIYIAPTIYTDKESGIIKQLDDKYQVIWNLPYESLANVNGRTWNINDILKIDGEILVTGSDDNIILNKYSISGAEGKIISIESKSDKTTDILVEFTFNEDIANKKFQAGSILILYGANGQRSGLYLTASDLNGPYMDVYDSSEENEVKPAVRIGNLSGIIDANFNQQQLKGYGLYSSNAFLRGQLMLPGAGITNQEDIVYNDSPIRIWAGIADSSQDFQNANFIVTADGSLYAKKGIFEGTVIARDSEFSGTIKAAGIVIDEGGDGTKPELNTDHFFVGYKSEPTSFNDYILDINSSGISIWEGGLRAYSDFASGFNNYGYKDNIYGYSEENKNPIPYLSLSDDGDGSTLQARVVMHKGHFFTIESSLDKYNTTSVIFDKGIWFNNNQYETLSSTIEKTSYYYSRNTGIKLENNILKILSQSNLMLSSKNTVYVNSTEDDINNIDNTSLLVRGQLKVVNDQENIIALDKQIIKEAIYDGESIGIDIIVS